MKIPVIGCLFNRHKPIRNRVKVTDEYTGYCKHCDASIKRVKHGVWQKYDVTVTVPAE